MDYLKYWSKETNPETGAKFEQFYGYLKSAHNGNMDVDAMIQSEYGEEFTKRLHIRFTYEDDAMGEAALEYYRSIGVKKEMFNGEEYYKRWTLFTPLEIYTDAGKDKKYPLVISIHGGGSSIEVDEFSTGYPQIAAREGFMVAYPQDPNWEIVNGLIDEISGKYPVDLERVYVGGFSQGGRYTCTSYMRIPQRLAAAAPCGNDCFCLWDGQSIDFTEEEYENFRRHRVPIFEIHGACDASSIIPLNTWVPRKDWKELAVSPDTDAPRGRNNIDDPAWIHDETRGFNPVHKDSGESPGWWFPRPNHPPEGCDRTVWQVEELNKLLKLVGTDPLDPEKCRAYMSTPEDEFHHTLGIYGEKERVETILGVKHYTAEYYNKETGKTAFRITGIENWPHWQTPLYAELCWAFFKKFRRDSRTGQVVEVE